MSAVLEQIHYLPIQYRAYSDQQRFKRVMAKLRAFLNPAEQVLTLYNNDDLNSHYARAIAYFRLGNLKKSLEELYYLLKHHPSDAYFHELQGQILFENGQLELALKSYERANNLHTNPNIQLGLAITKINLAEINPKNLQHAQSAIILLKKIITEEPENLLAHKFLAEGYSLCHDTGQSYLTLASMAAIMNNKNDVLKYAKLSLKDAKPGTHLFIMAQDLLYHFQDKK